MSAVLQCGRVSISYEVDTCFVGSGHLNIRWRSLCLAEIPIFVVRKDVHAAVVRQL